MDIAQVTALIAVLATAVVFGTDAFCALVQRPALARVDDRSLVVVMGYVHLYGDRRMPVPGAVSIIASAATAAIAAATGRWTASAAAVTALGLLLLWIVLYVLVSAPINRQLTAAAQSTQTPANARALQHNWDRIITVRATLQGLAVVALCIALVA
jgi:hypothetical protein